MGQDLRYEGAVLELFWIEPGADEYTRCLVAAVGERSRPIAVIPAGCWQTARTTSEYTLVGCDVGPGFEPEDYLLLGLQPAEAVELPRRFPELAEYL
jgi:predicted cupin superfamily sugar epimerase